MSRTITVAGNEHVTCGDMAVTEGIANLTVSFWGKKSATAKEIFVGKWLDTTSAYFIEPFTNGKVYIGVYNSLPSNGSVAFDNDVWNHYMMVFDGNGATKADMLKLYINGVLKTLSFNAHAMATTTGTDTAEFEIGSLLGTSRTDADIAEVKIWTASLSAGEVMSDYGGKIPRMDSLVAYWPLGQGSPEGDLSGNGNDGTLVNSPAIADHSPNMAAFGWDGEQPFAVSAAPPASTLAWARYGTYLKRRLLILSGLFRMAFAKLIPHAPHP